MEFLNVCTGYFHYTSLQVKDLYTSYMTAWTQKEKLNL